MRVSGWMCLLGVVPALALAATAAADVIRPTRIGVNLCANVAQTSYPEPPDSPHSCGPLVITGPGNLGTFCASANPLGAWTAVQDITGQFGASGGMLTFTVAGPDGTAVTTDVVMQGRSTLKTLGSFASGTYTLTIEFGGFTVVTNEVKTALPSAMTGTFTVESCLPTSEEQCKDGGWQGYDVFKNQGDCVSFVATRGKNQPG